MESSIEWDQVDWDAACGMKQPDEGGSDDGDADTSDGSALNASLLHHFGFSTFRPQQRELIEACIAGRDTMALMATGAGKSICYQLPPLHIRRTDRSRRTTMTVVVSPLISLMEDQVMALQQRGVAAEQLSSSQRDHTAHARAMRGECALIYVSPERLRSLLPELRRFHATHGILSVAIDEAHCVSEWGHDFRPAYRELASIRSELPGVPLMLLTATATRAVERDILTSLSVVARPARGPGKAPTGGPRSMSSLLVARSSFNRPNLHYAVRLKSPARGVQDIVALVSATHGADARASTIVYCPTRRATEEIAAELRRAVPAVATAAYHAALPLHVRRSVHTRFVRDELRCVVATVAFGMGIDKPDIRLVVHWGPSRTVEGYYQQTGRAGRDGAPSRCVLFFSAADFSSLERLVTLDSSSSSSSSSGGGSSSSGKRAAYTRPARASGVAHGPARLRPGDLPAHSKRRLVMLHAVRRLCNTRTCLRSAVLAYFDEECTFPSVDDRAGGSCARVPCCGACDDAARGRVVLGVELGDDARLLLRAVRDTGSRFGR